MRRRPKPDEDAGAARGPLRLRRFDPDEWGGDSSEAAGRWWAAREEWEAEHGEAPDLDDSHPIPDEPWDASYL